MGRGRATPVRLPCLMHGYTAQGSAMVWRLFVTARRLTAMRRVMAAGMSGAQRRQPRRHAATPEETRRVSVRTARHVCGRPGMCPAISGAGGVRAKRAAHGGACPSARSRRRRARGRSGPQAGGRPSSVARWTTPAAGRVPEARPDEPVRLIRTGRGWPGEFWGKASGDA